MTGTLVTPHQLETEGCDEVATDVSVVIRRCCDVLEDLARIRRVGLTREAAGEATCHADAAAVEAIVRSLLLDAILCSGSSESVVVRTEACDKNLHIDITTHGAEARMYFGRVFQPFMPAAPGADEGFRLRAVRRQVERLGGRLRTSSDLGRNSTFTVILPRSPLPAGEILG